MIQPTPFEPSDSLRAFDNIGRVLADLARDFQHRTLAKLRQRGHARVRTSHSAVVGHLGLETLRLTELAQRGGITQQAMGKLVKELERTGYLRRTLDEADRRARQIQLTERGVELLEDLAAVFLEVQAEYASVLGTSELDRMEQQLRTAKQILGTDAASVATTRPAAALLPTSAVPVALANAAARRPYIHHR